MNIKEFETFMKKLNSKRPFKMYMHGCRDSSVANKFVEEKEDLKCSRNNIYSTFVNCGTPNTDFIKRMQEYNYYDELTNVIMIMPSDIKIDNYCGCLKGQEYTTRGYTNPVEIDYLTVGCNNSLNNESGSNYNLQFVDNRLILGYMDNKTNQFVINPECILLTENLEEYDNFIKNATTSANEIYDNALCLFIYGEIKINTKNYTKEELSTLKGIMADEELRNDFIEYAKYKYEVSDEKKFYDDIENCEFRNSVPPFESILKSTINFYLAPSLNNDEIDDLLNSL